MTWFSLPETNAANRAAFYDSSSASDWLASQPRANAAAMLDALVIQLRAYNTFSTPARERFKTLETLRKMVFAVNGESLRRFDNKPLPLLPAEQAVLDATRRLWRACTVGYLHCLRACLNQDEGISSRSDKVAHRALTSLRMEQLCCYQAGCDVDGRFWRNLHAIYASAETLGVLAKPVEDTQPRETADSTVSGQYCMALLLHLANPFSLTRSQFAAAVRWFARWREQAVVHAQPEVSPKSCCIALDLAQDQALHDHFRSAREGRWLVADNVLRKIRKRIEALHGGETPENLKLGNTLSTEACIALLETLSHHLQSPSYSSGDSIGETALVEVVFGLENIYRLLGGKSLQEPLHSSSFVGRIKADQLAVFGHVVDPESHHLPSTETWQADRLEADTLWLRRDATSGGARLLLRNVLGVRLSSQEKLSLATISMLSAHLNEVKLRASLFSGEICPLVIEQKERPTGRLARYPALCLIGLDGERQVILPAGLNPRTNPIRVYDGVEHSLLDCRLKTLIERAGDHERWSVSGEPETSA